jgi:hypothetical protein
MSMPMKKGQGLSWNPASFELPDIPTVPAGQDALSSTIAAVLPTLAAELTANVATLQAKEGMFAGKLGVADAAYATSDDSGSQSVGQVVGALGQLGQQAGQMGQMASAPAQAAGQGGGMFGSLIQQAMQAAQGGHATGEQQPPGQQPPGQQVPGATNGVPHAGQRDGDPKADHEHDEHRREREPLQRADERTMAGPDAHRSGPAPVEPPRHSADDDLGRRL